MGLGYLKKLFSYLICFFYSLFFQNATDLAKEFKHFKHESTLDYEQWYRKLFFLHSYVGLEVFDANQELDWIYKKLKSKLNEPKLIMKHIIIYMKLLMLLAPKDETLYVSSVLDYPIVGFKKNNLGKIVLNSISEEYTWQCLNCLNISDDQLACFCIYGYLRTYLASCNELDQSYFQSIAHIINLYEEIIKIINQALKRRWLYGLFGFNRKYDHLLMQFKITHKTWLNKEKNNISDYWVDPWLYLYERSYRIQFDLCLKQLNATCNGLSLIVERWFESWFDEEKELLLGWYDLILLDKKFLKIIAHRWPLVGVYITALLKKIDIVDVWRDFKRAFLLTDHTRYQEKRLVFWQKKWIKYQYFFITDRQNFTKKMSLFNDEALIELYPTIIYKLHHVKWHLDSDSLTFEEKLNGDISSIYLLRFYLNDDSLIPSSILILWAIRNSYINDNKKLLLLINHATEKTVNKIKKTLIPAQKNKFMKQIHHALKKHGWNINFHTWLHDEPYFNKDLFMALFQCITQLSNTVPEYILYQETTLSSLPLYIDKFSDTGFKQALCQCPIYLKWLFLLSKRHLIADNDLDQYIKQTYVVNQLENAKATILNIKTMNEFNDWILVYKIDELIILKLKVELKQCFYKLLYNEAKKYNLGKLCNQLPNKHILILFLTEQDIAYLNLIKNKNAVIDHWLLTAPEFLLNAIWTSPFNFTINPLIQWLHSRYIFRLEPTDVKRIQTLSILLKRNHHVSADYLSSWLHVLDDCDSDNEVWQQITILQTNQMEENNDRDSTIQKKYNCGMRFI